MARAKTHLPPSAGPHEEAIRPAGRRASHHQGVGLGLIILLLEPVFWYNFRGRVDYSRPLRAPSGETFRIVSRETASFARCPSVSLEISRSHRNVSSDAPRNIKWRPISSKSSVGLGGSFFPQALAPTESRPTKCRSGVNLGRSKRRPRAHTVWPANNAWEQRTTYRCF